MMIICVKLQHTCMRVPRHQRVKNIATSIKMRSFNLAFVFCLLYSVSWKWIRYCVIRSRLEYCGTVSNLEKSRLSRSVRQSGLSRKFFWTRQMGSGQIEKNECPEFCNYYVKMCCDFNFSFITNIFVFKRRSAKPPPKSAGAFFFNFIFD
jgi:hypothetical protein